MSCNDRRIQSNHASFIWKINEDVFRSGGWQISTLSGQFVCFFSFFLLFLLFLGLLVGLKNVGQEFGKLREFSIIPSLMLIPRSRISFIAIHWGSFSAIWFWYAVSPEAVLYVITHFCFVLSGLVLFCLVFCIWRGSSWVTSEISGGTLTRSLSLCLSFLHHVVTHHGYWSARPACFRTFVKR